MMITFALLSLQHRPLYSSKYSMLCCLTQRQISRVTFHLYSAKALLRGSDKHGSDLNKSTSGIRNLGHLLELTETEHGILARPATQLVSLLKRREEMQRLFTPTQKAWASNECTGKPIRLMAVLLVFLRCGLFQKERCCAKPR